MVTPCVLNARGDVKGECVAGVEVVQAGTRRVLCLSFQEEIGISIAPSSNSNEVDKERRVSRWRDRVGSAWQEPPSTTLCKTQKEANIVSRGCIAGIVTRPLPTHVLVPHRLEGTCILGMQW